MREKLTHTDTLQLREVVELGGDLLLLPQEEAFPYEEARALQVAGIIPCDQSTIYQHTWNFDVLQEKYNHERAVLYAEPAWVAAMPMAVKTRLRVIYASTQEDVLAIVNMFPNVAIRYIVRDGGLCADFSRAVNLFRLEGIKQLGFLQSPWCRSLTKWRTPLSESTRYLHSLDVMAVATLIGNNLDLPESEFNTLRVAALTHDMGTPAGGDSVKLVDLAALDEDANYPALLGAYDWGGLQREYGIKCDLLVDAVQHNGGLIGKALDMADKIAYVGRDIHTCLHHIEAGAAGDEQLGLRTLKRLVERHPHVCGIWDAIERDGEQLFFTDPGRIIAFLKVRVLLFRELYYHPYSRFGEFLMSRLLVKAMYEKGKLTKAELLQMSDWELLDKMNREYGSGHYSLQPILDTCSSSLSRCESFATREDADRFVARLREGGNLFTLMEDNSRLIKTGTNLLVRSGGVIAPLKELYPGDARELDEMAGMLPQIHVYYLDGDPALPREQLAKLKEELGG